VCDNLWKLETYEARLDLVVQIMSFLHQNHYFGHFQQPKNELVYERAKFE